MPQCWDFTGSSGHFRCSHCLTCYFFNKINCSILPVVCVYCLSGRFLRVVWTDMVEEGRALADKPHIVISTPGRLADHINTGTNFSLKKLRFLVRNQYFDNYNNNSNNNNTLWIVKISPFYFSMNLMENITVVWSQISLGFDWMEQGLTSHSTQFRSFWKRWDDCSISQDCSRRNMKTNNKENWSFWCNCVFVLQLIRSFSVVIANSATIGRYWTRPIDFLMTWTTTLVSSCRRYSLHCQSTGRHCCSVQRWLTSYRKCRNWQWINRFSGRLKTRTLSFSAMIEILEFACRLL